MKQYQMPIISVVHIEPTHTLDLSGGGDFWGEDDAEDDHSLADDYHEAE